MAEAAWAMGIRLLMAEAAWAMGIRLLMAEVWDARCAGACLYIGVSVLTSICTAAGAAFLGAGVCRAGAALLSTDWVGTGGVGAGGVGAGLRAAGRLNIIAELGAIGAGAVR